MSDDQFSYSQAKGRLDDIVVEVRKKDISLEKSLDLLEEGVRLANRCTELIDQADWDALVEPDPPAADDLDLEEGSQELQERHNG
ncbi:MAG: exodeoxyribonuclease VII small subunit [Coriobacteriia bacterium]|nr:exodeoxyribonuclease VII small subunit [Coriobacteriia bacterium]